MVATGAGITLLPELASRGAYGDARGVTCARSRSPRRPEHRRGLAQDERARPAIEALCKVIETHAG